jgi:hypothetical protein
MMWYNGGLGAEGKRPLGRHRHKWKNNIKLGFKKRDWETWTGLLMAQGGDRLQALVNVIMNPRVPYSVLVYSYLL